MERETLRHLYPRGLRIVVPRDVRRTQLVDLVTGDVLGLSVLGQHRVPPLCGWHGFVSLHAEVRAAASHAFIVQTESLVEEIECAAAWHGGDRNEIFDVRVRLGDSGTDVQVERADGQPLGRALAGLEFYLDADAEPPYLMLYPEVETVELE